MKILIIVLGIIGVFFLLGFGYWFKKHPISRDRVLSKFGKTYFRLLIFIVCSSIFVIAGIIEFIPVVVGKLKFLSKLNLECLYSISEAVKYCTKMGSPKDENVLLTVLVMLFQIVVFEGLIIAAIVGWTGRRTKMIQKGQVRYSKEHLNGTFVSLWDKCDENQRWFLHYFNYLQLLIKHHFSKSNTEEDKKEDLMNNFAVVIGANEVAPSVIKNLLKREDEKKKSLNYAHETENQYVILQTSSEIGEVRQTLKAYLTEEEYSRVIIYSDIRNSYEGLQALHLEDASEIYVLGENTTVDGGETFHDTMNMRCVNMIADELIRKHNKESDYNKLIELEKSLKKENQKAEAEQDKARIKALKEEINNVRELLLPNRNVCKVLFEYQTTFSIFQFSDVPEKVRYSMKFIPFNRYDSWARRVMMDNKAIALVDENNANSHQQINYTPLDGFKGIKPDDSQRVHFIVVGMSKMGVAMGIQALYQAHYPNYVYKNNLKSRITFIDANAKQEMDFFKGRYATLFELARHRYIDANKCPTSELNSDDAWVDPAAQSDYKWGHLSKDGKNFLDVEIEFVKGELESEGVREYLRQVTADKQSKVTIAICLPLTHQSVAAALYMPLEVYKEVQEIWVYQREASDIITNINPLENHNDDVYEYYKKLKPFGMLYGEYIDSRTYYLKALLVNGIYEINDIDNKMYFTKIDLGKEKKETYKDLRKSWKNLTVEKTWSNKYFVDTIYQKIRSTNLALSENAAIIGYNNNEFFTGNWKEKLETALAELSKPIGQDKKECLAECEHNRWNVQQLLLGFRPADAVKFDELCKEQATETANVKPIKDEITTHKENIINQLVELNKQIHYTNGDVTNKSFTSLLEFIEKNEKKEEIKNNYKDLFAAIETLAKKEEKIKEEQKPLKDKKAVLKSPKNKIHYCICDFALLEAVDPGAKGYDKQLNDGIPIILEKVDDYHCSTQQ